MSKTAQLLALAEAATPGPWWKEDGAPRCVYAKVKGGRPNGEGLLTVAYYGTVRPNDVPDAAFIAAANPETIKQLVEQMNVLVAALSAIRTARDDMEMWGIANDTLEAFNKWENGE